MFLNLDSMEESIVTPTGSPLKLVCDVEGYPEPEVHWLKDGALLNNERRSHTTLKVLNLSKKDNGQYTCVATNRLGSRNFTFNVQVIGEIMLIKSWSYIFIWF